MIKVLLADEQALVRAEFHAQLGHAGDIVVVGEAADGDEAVALTRQMLPDVVLMAVRMPGLDGVAATEQLCADPDLAGTRIIVVTTLELDEHVYAALRAGAAGFLFEDVEPDELRRAVRVIAGGEALSAPSVTRRLIEEFTRRAVRSADGQERLALLTGRDREVVALVGRGLSDEELAAELIVSPETAKMHVAHARTKLSARARVQLVVFAYDHGLV